MESRAIEHPDDVGGLLAREPFAQPSFGDDVGQRTTEVKTPVDELARDPGQLAGVPEDLIGLEP